MIQTPKSQIRGRAALQTLGVFEGVHTCPSTEVPGYFVLRLSCSVTDFLTTDSNSGSPLKTQTASLANACGASENPTTRDSTVEPQAIRKHKHIGLWSQTLALSSRASHCKGT